MAGPEPLGPARHATTLEETHPGEHLRCRPITASPQSPSGGSRNPAPPTAGGGAGAGPPEAPAPAPAVAPAATAGARARHSYLDDRRGSLYGS